MIIDLHYNRDEQLTVRHAASGATCPTDLLAASLGSCLMQVFQAVARRRQVDLTGLHIVITRRMTDDIPAKVAALESRVEWPPGLAKAERQRLEKAARTCPVHQALHPDIEAPIVFVSAVER